MLAVYIILGILLFNLCLYVFILVRPHRNKEYNQALLCRYAHRGLHNSEIPENSLKAFQNACENGYGIELDIQLSKDGEVMVFHDYTLLRMTGEDKKLKDLSLEELKQLSLKDSDQKIPTLKEVLKLIDGKVPLLVELKGESLNGDLCPKAAEILKEYKGDFCIESFNPFLIMTMRKYMPDLFYGQLYTNVCRDKKKYSLLNIFLTLMAFNILAKPDFIAYNKRDRKALPVALTTRVYKAPKFVWTVKNQDEIDHAISLGEFPIFEYEI